MRWLRSQLALGSFTFHALAALAVLVPAAGVPVRAFAQRDERVHGLGCTFILHATGEVAVRLPSSGLWRTGVLTHVAPEGVICTCGAYLLAWVAWIVFTPWRRWLAERRSGPRRFPLD